MNPSKNDVLGPLAYFLGTPADPVKLDSYTEGQAATLHFPDAYYGENVKLREELNNLVLSSPQHWQTNVALPWLQLDGVNVTWDEVRFDVRLMQRTPYEGASRLTTSVRDHHRDRIVRHGLAMVIEHDFYRTPTGRKFFGNQITSIAYCVQETCNFDVLLSYLQCEAYDFKYDGRKHLLDRRAIRQSCTHEINMFACLQKEGRGFDKAVEESKARMRRYNHGGMPNMLVIDPRTALYVTTTATDRLTFIEGGERAVTEFREGVEGFTTKAYRGMGIFESNPFDAGDNVAAMQPLERQMQVGEWYQMAMPQVWDQGTDGKLPLNAASMAIKLFDEVRDTEEVITLKTIEPYLYVSEIFTDALGFKENGAPPVAESDGYDPLGLIAFYANDDAAVTDAATASGFNKETINKWRANFASTNGNTNPTGGFVYNSKDDANGWSKVIKDAMDGKWVPLRFTLARPFIEHSMVSMVMAVSGQDTGAMLYGPSDMQISANTQVKTIEGHYTGHFKAVITKPQNVLVIRDAQCVGYRAGCDTQFFGNADGKVEDVGYDIDDRLNFQEEDSNRYKSLLVFITPYEGKESNYSAPDTAFSITNQVAPWDATRVNSANTWSLFPGGNSFFNAYNTQFKLSQYILSGQDPSDVSNKAFIRAGSYNNSFCFPGPYRSYDPFGGLKGAHVWRDNPGQGHFGATTRAGDGRWRKGGSVDMKTARGQMSDAQ